MNRTLYTLLLHLISPLLVARLLWRSRTLPAYRQRLLERFGLRFPALRAGGIWIHAVSVGETIAAEPLVKALLERHPELPITLTGMTPTGSERIRALFGSRVQHCYLPYDLPWAAAHFLRKVQPKLAIIMETELWPNHMALCAKRHIPVVLANARLSARSARGYARFPKLFRPMFAAVSWFAVQTEAEARRFRFLGAHPNAISVTGSIKFDLRIDPALPPLARERREDWNATQRPVWVAASTHEGEEDAVLAAHRRILSEYPDALLVLVPRHPDRFERVYELCESLHFNTARRSKGQFPDFGTQVFLGDTMGELPFFYALSDVAFVGGSLINHGGHNLLEPAALRLPILTGPHLFNFLEIARQLHQAGALDQVQDVEALVLRVIRLFQSPERRLHMGQAGLNVLTANQGALTRLLAGLERVLNTGSVLPPSLMVDPHELGGGVM